MSMTGTFTRLLTVGAVALTLAGCERARGALQAQSYDYQGYAFKGKVQRGKEDRADFAVTVRGADRGLPGAMEAARIAANRYCIEQYGNTDITWSGITPDTDLAEVAMPDNGILELSGRCASW